MQDQAPGVVLAHPLTEPFHLPFSPLTAAFLLALAVLTVALIWPPRPGPDDRAADDEVSSWAGPLNRVELLTRCLGVALLHLAIACGRFGVHDELENLAPALVIGFAWPALFLASVVSGRTWRLIDPWDTLARVIDRDPPHPERASVWPAAVLALPWVWYLSVYQDTLSPRSVGAALALYTVTTLAGCLAFGRARWLATSEPLGITLHWVGMLPRRRLAGWVPPAGAEALLGVLIGGVLFGAIRRSELWGDLNVDPNATLLATTGLLASCLAVTAILKIGMDERAPVTRGAVPALVGIVVAVALDTNRLFTSVQLLPGLLGDPFGWGWDLLGRAGPNLNPAPVGDAGLIWLQLSLLALGHISGAVVFAWRAPQDKRIRGAIALAVLGALSMISLLSH